MKSFALSLSLSLLFILLDGKTNLENYKYIQAPSDNNS